MTTPWTAEQLQSMFATLHRLSMQPTRLGDDAAVALGYIEQRDAACSAMRDQRDHDRRIVTNLAHAVHHAIHTGGSLADVVAAIDALPAIESALEGATP